jgi:hypothetical protein
MSMIKEKLLETNPFAVAAGDGADPARSILFKDFMRKLDLVRGLACRRSIAAVAPTWGLTACGAVYVLRHTAA